MDMRRRTTSRLSDRQTNPSALWVKRMQHEMQRYATADEKEHMRMMMYYHPLFI